ncbi:MAG: Uma2 family endonuclease [Deltaproteobacteria bacterium]|nr:Uma2 family endonuclease [Deltaproteobacteria bacterium]
MIAVPKRRATHQDIVDLPEGVIGEIIDGELHTQPRPAIPHAGVSTKLSALLTGPFDFGRNGPGGWLILFEPEVHVGPDPDVLVPDLAGWRRERMSELPRTAVITIAPDWVCEILSPGTAKTDRSKKLTVYARERVGHVWLIDPELKTLEVYRWSEDGWVLRGLYTDSGRARAEPFEAIELELDLLFSR